jgi:hypothetical protein
MSHTCHYIVQTNLKDLHRVKPNRTAGFNRAVRALDGDTNWAQVSNLRSELLLGIVCVGHSNGMTNTETSLIISVTDIAVDCTGAVSFLSKLNSQLILFTMYNNLPVLCRSHFAPWCSHVVPVSGMCRYGREYPIVCYTALRQNYLFNSDLQVMPT